MNGKRRALFNGPLPCNAGVIGAGILLLSLAAGCEGERGSPGRSGAGAPPPDLPTELDPEDDLPGVVAEITKVGGASGADATFQPGDKVSVTFALTMNDGTDLPLDQLDSGGIYLSGPTFNYQRVLERQSDVITASRKNTDGTYTYTFAARIPGTYLPPLNDTDSITDGELQGTALLAGTYTVGLELYKNYTVESESFRDVGNATLDLLFGGATTIDRRELVSLENCNQCHQQLRVHGGIRRDTRLCVLCHTAGAEDGNDPSVENGTPGQSIEFKVMVHKIHNGEHLPSVLGVATKTDGTRNYAATPEPYLLIGFSNRVSDFSEVAFPVFPNLNTPMPRDAGYSALGSTEKALEDSIRTGVTDCAKCHGDPDGSGPLPPPAEGGIAYSQPSRRACGSCHDDIVDWNGPYTANTQTMPAQSTDSACTMCHEISGSALDVVNAHVHPLHDVVYNPGLRFELSSLEEAGLNDADGTFDPGEKVAITFRMKNDSGADVLPSEIASVSTVVNGPVNNRNLLLSTSIPLAALSGSPPYTLKVPMPVLLEYLKDDSGADDEFPTDFFPHWNVSGALTAVLVRTATGAASSDLAEASLALQNYADVSSTSGFARDHYVVLDDDTSQEEYVQVALVDGNRLWFKSALRGDHGVGAGVVQVILTSKKEGVDYTLDAASGTIRELIDFGEGNAVIASYTTDYVLPSRYPPAFNDSPGLDRSFGKWRGLDIADGTYTFGIWGSKNVVVTLYGETQTYRGTSHSATQMFLVGSATSEEHEPIISSAANCYSCHNDLWLHGGGRRGFDTCLLCHGTSGPEDRPRYVAANAPDTPQLTIEFRNMLHKIHMGEDLTYASDYKIVGFGSAAYPDNYGLNSYESVVFPAMPGRVMQCTKCHGAESSTWEEPAERNHPTQPGVPTRSWRTVCGSCHDSGAAQAHIDINTSGTGVESCAVCHERGADYDVWLVHKTR